MKLCKLRGGIVDICGKPEANVSINLYSYSPPQTMMNDTFTFLSFPHTVLTDENGLFEIDLVQGLICEVSVPLVGFRKKIQVPFTSTGLLFLL